VTTFRLDAHAVRLGKTIIEVYDGEHFIGAIYPGDNPREFRIVSKYQLEITAGDSSQDGIFKIVATEIKISREFNR
jgi:hypothetical protein